MRPASLLLKALAVLAGLALIMAGFRLFAPDTYSSAISSAWWTLLGAFTVAAAWDSLGRSKPLKVARNLPGSFAVGVGNKVDIRLENTSRHALRLVVMDHHPEQVEVEGLPIVLSLSAGEAAQLNYWAYPRRRGDAEFGDVDVRITSRLGLWQFRQRFPLPGTAKVYPNFTAISQFEQLGHVQQMNQLGVHLLQRRGQGMDFQQLRDYRDGDVSRQIDWKASARRRKLISRDYQDERDQDIIFLLDCGRRMRAKDANLSHFDHCLNSLLLLSYAALRQGDGVGLLSFAGEQRWLPPVKGKNNINLLLNTVYNLHSSTDASDLVEAGTELMLRRRKRALVVVLSNLREEDRDDVMAATQLLARKHLVLVASLRENFLDQAMDVPVTDLESSLVYCESSDIIARRSRLLRTLKSKGVLVTDSTPQRLHIDLLNEYWALKRSGRI